MNQPQHHGDAVGAVDRDEDGAGHAADDAAGHAGGAVGPEQVERLQGEVFAEGAGFADAIFLMFSEAVFVWYFQSERGHESADGALKKEAAPAEARGPVGLWNAFFHAFAPVMNEV